MGPGTEFRLQHDARWQPDGTLTIFDDEAPPTPARALVLRLDVSTMTVSLVRAYERRQATTVTSQGNVQRLPNGNVFVGWGASPCCSEFTSDGRLLFDATFPAAKQSYRDFRCAWTGRPVDRPSIAVDDDGADAVTVFASWNGATDVTGWQVLAGTGEGDVAALATVPRRGFETAIGVRTGAPLIAVRVLDASGRGRGTSAAVGRMTSVIGRTSSAIGRAAAPRY
jgi:hypothetical protein